MLHESGGAASCFMETSRKEQMVRAPSGGWARAVADGVGDVPQQSQAVLACGVRVGGDQGEVEGRSQPPSLRPCRVQAAH
mmetsp:Transcript_30345/g.59642  ORF Transcript_30345/g.59642 Transcript_30345/m.59642 type:complete len:80 (+) Transcript_30345:105-344(+)